MCLQSRMRDSLTEVGVSVTSGAISTLGATLFLFFPTIDFFGKFGKFIFATICLSWIFAVGLFATMMMIIGPEGNTGSLKAIWNRCRGGVSGSSEV